MAEAQASPGPKRQREITLLVNGTEHRLSVDPSEPLLWVLRDRLKLTGTKFGCGEGACGACSVLIDGEVYRSCVVAVGDVASGEAITTIEGLGVPGSLSPLQQAFIDHTAFGCGFCTPGMIVTATALLKGTKKPSRQQIITAMDDNLCRCASHPAILEAIEHVAGSKREPED
ncbi:MAG: (2Fe-2S)-binding protein [Holophagae bacterium]|jgi:aerobic-type carbon monoxide dehydrogenase small subunit (CoxS/CutS family)